MAPDRAGEIEVRPADGGAPSSPKEKDLDAFPYKQLTILAICRFSEPIAFNSILAYTYLMVRDLRGTEQDASFYAGLLVSAYAVAEAMTAMGWGALSDRYGRKPIVLLGLGGVALSCLIFGLAKNYWVALLARFIGGLLNGNVSVMQTMVAEAVKNPEHEPKAYATQPFVWVLGGILGSAMGGFLAQPALFYPEYFSKDGIFGRNPYLLPNLVAVVAILIAILQGYIFLEETNPRAWRHAAASESDEQAVSDDDDDETMHGSEEDVIDERTPLNRRTKRHSTSRAGYNPADSRVTGPVFMEESLPLPVDQNFDLRRASMSTVASFRGDGLRGVIAPAGSGSGCVRDQMPKPSGSESEAEYDGPVYSFRILMLSLAMVLVSYHQMAFSALFPIHLLDKPAVPYPVPHSGHVDFTGGLGYTVHDVGSYLATNGVIGLFIQGVIFPVFVDRVGVWRSFILMVAMYPTAYILMPFISAMPDQQLASAGLYLSMMMQSFYGIISMPCALILLKDSIPHSSVLGRVNGLAMSGCCLARTISPPLGGIIYSAGGSAASWFSCAGVALLGIVQLFWIPSKPALPVEGSDGGENGTVTVEETH